MNKKTSTIETIWHTNSIVKQETIYVDDKKMELRRNGMTQET